MAGPGWSFKKDTMFHCVSLSHVSLAPHSEVVVKFGDTDDREPSRDSL
jgi:hypothetical protein